MIDSIVEILNATGWPHITLIFAIIFILMFQKDIRNFIQRTRRVGKDGVYADIEMISQKAEEMNPGNILDHIEIEKPILLKEVEESIFEDIKTRGLDYQGDTIRILVRNLAVTKIYLEHEQSYSSILGSQIDLLKKLNEASDIGLDSNFINEYFNDVRSIYPEAFSTWSSENYTQYLFARELITILNGNHHLTHKGQDFLIWLTKTGKAEDKGF